MNREKRIGSLFAMLAIFCMIAGCRMFQIKPVEKAQLESAVKEAAARIVSRRLGYHGYRKYPEAAEAVAAVARQAIETIDSAATGGRTDIRPLVAGFSAILVEKLSSDPLLSPDVKELLNFIEIEGDEIVVRAALDGFLQGIYLAGGPDSTVKGG